MKIGSSSCGRKVFCLSVDAGKNSRLLNEGEAPVFFSDSVFSACSVVNLS
jgi:hypothetical protein